MQIARMYNFSWIFTKFTASQLQIFPRHRDALLEKYFNKGSFSELQQEDIGRPKKSLLVG